MRKKAPEKPPKPYNLFYCERCGVGDMEHGAFLAHLKEAHGIEEAMGTRKPLIHADGVDFFLWQYQWTIGGLKFVQETLSLRRGADRAMWRDGG